MVKKRATPADARLDPVDRAIIEQLQHDGRMPFTKIGGAVGLSEAAARQRVQRLLDAGVIQVVAVTNPLSLGKRRMAMIGVRVSGPVEGLAAEIESIEGVEYLVVTAGQFDLLCEVLVADDSGAALDHQPVASDPVSSTPRRSSTSTWSSRTTSGARTEDLRRRGGPQCSFP